MPALFEENKGQYNDVTYILIATVAAKRKTKDNHYVADVLEYCT